MKFETIKYWAVEIKEMREQLPDFVKSSAIMKFPCHQQKDFLEINIKNQEAIEYLDIKLKDSISNNQYTRRYHIEIDEDEIPNYRYFRISPECLEYGRHTFGNCRMPDCGGPNIIQTNAPRCPFIELNPNGNCRVGEKLLSPVRVKKKKAGKLDLAELHYGGKEVVLLVSARLKRIFDAEGVTGLDYESAGFLDAVKKVDYYKSDGISYITYKEIVEEDSPVIEPPYLARIPQMIYSRADEVVISDTECTVHHVFQFRKIFNLCAVPEGLCTQDFFQVEGVQIKGQIYNYNFNKYYVTRKVLELLLKYKAVKGFQKGLFLNKPFFPVV